MEPENLEIELIKYPADKVYCRLCGRKKIIGLEHKGFNTDTGKRRIEQVPFCPSVEENFYKYLWRKYIKGEEIHL